MPPVMQAARETFELARDTVAHAFQIPSGNAQAQLEPCDLACCQAIVDARAIKDAGQRHSAIKDALAAAAGRRARQAAADAAATVKRQEVQAACRRVLESGCGYSAEEGFAALAVLSEDEQASLAALDVAAVDPAAVEAIFAAASARIEAAAAAQESGVRSQEPGETAASDAERMLPEIPAGAGSEAGTAPAAPADPEGSPPA